MCPLIDCKTDGWIDADPNRCFLSFHTISLSVVAPVPPCLKPEADIKFRIIRHLQQSMKLLRQNSKYVGSVLFLIDCMSKALQILQKMFD